MTQPLIATGILVARLSNSNELSLRETDYPPGDSFPRDISPSQQVNVGLSKPHPFDNTNHIPLTIQ